MLLISLSTVGLAHADLMSFDLGFVAPDQSMWGPGSGSLDFGVKGIIGSKGTVGIGYDIGASTGTVQGSVNGVFNVNYNPSRTGVGSSPISLSYAGNSDGGIVSSALGAWVNFDAYLLNLSYDLYDKNYSLDIHKAFTPQIGTAVSGSDSFTAKSVGVDVWLAGASLDFDIEQTDHFKPTALDGTLLYSLRGSGVSTASPFFLASGSTAILEANLDKPGTWDFSFLPFTLENRFNVEFDLELVARAYYKTLDWGDHWYDFWKAHFDTHSTEFALLDLDVYDADPFALRFNPDVFRPNVFSISVDGSTPVPEPATILLLGLALAGLAGWRRRMMN